MFYKIQITFLFYCVDIFQYKIVREKKRHRYVTSFTPIITGVISMENQAYFDKLSSFLKTTITDR